jgi:hypothetical protein
MLNDEEKQETEVRSQESEYKAENRFYRFCPLLFRLLISGFRLFF